jgi:hypothetical protein
MEAGLTRPELSERDSLRQEALLAAGTMSWMRADHDAARRELQEGADIAGELGDRRQQALMLAILGQSLVHAGDLAASRTAFDQSVPLAREVGDPYVLNRTLTALADLERRAGNDAATVAAASEALSISEQLDPGLIGFNRFFMGTGLKRTDPDRARAELILALEIFDRVNHQLGLYAALVQLVDLTGPAPETGARLIGAVDNLHELSGVANTDDDYNAAVDRARSAVVEALGLQRSEVLIAEGRALHQSEVIDLARQLGAP